MSCCKSVGRSCRLGLILLPHSSSPIPRHCLTQALDKSSHAGIGLRRRRIPILTKEPLRRHLEEVLGEFGEPLLSP